MGRRRGSDLALPWLWHRPAATTLIQPLAWEPPYAADMALKQTNKKTKKNNKKTFKVKPCKAILEINGEKL